MLPELRKKVGDGMMNHNDWASGIAASEARQQIARQQMFSSGKTNGEKSGWIPVTERLPTEKDSTSSHMIIVYDSDAQEVDISYYPLLGMPKYRRYTHWQRLPEPPRGGDGV